MSTDLAAARTILEQIPLGVKMSLGMRDHVALEHGLQSRVGGTARRWLEISVNGRDLYDVRLFKLRRCEQVDVCTRTDVDAVALGRVLLDVEREGFRS